MAATQAGEVYTVCIVDVYSFKVNTFILVLKNKYHFSISFLTYVLFYIILINECQTKNTEELTASIPEKDSLFTTFFKNGVLKEVGLIKKGKQESKWFAFDEDGSKYLEVEFKNDSLHGEYIEYRDDKVFSKENYINGVKEGYCVYYNFGTGLIRLQDEYRNGVEDGI